MSLLIPSIALDTLAALESYWSTQPFEKNPLPSQIDFIKTPIYLPRHNNTFSLRSVDKNDSRSLVKVPTNSSCFVNVYTHILNTSIFVFSFITFLLMPLIVLTIATIVSRTL